MKMRKRATSQELADYFGVARQTIRVWKKDFNAAYKNHPYDSKDIHSVWNFFVYILNEKTGFRPPLYPSVE